MVHITMAQDTLQILDGRMEEMENDYFDSLLTVEKRPWIYWESRWRMPELPKSMPHIRPAMKLSIGQE